MTAARQRSAERSARAAAAALWRCCSPHASPWCRQHPGGRVKSRSRTRSRAPLGQGSAGELADLDRETRSTRAHHRTRKRAFLALDTGPTARPRRPAGMLWGARPGMARVRWLYSERLAFARTEFESTTEDMARVLHPGAPGLSLRVEVHEFFTPLEIWGWPCIEASAGCGRALLSAWSTGRTACGTGPRAAGRCTQP
jgi:hypothetical protein